MSIAAIDADAAVPTPASAASVSCPHDRDLSAPELEAFVSELAQRSELWSGLVRHDATRRVYEQLLGDPYLSAWLICWMDDHDTGFHDHDVSCGAVAVIDGSVHEERLTVGGQPHRRTFAAGDTFNFCATDIHRVRHGGSKPAVTLHVYSPPLDRMGAYLVDEHGVLARHPVSSSVELRPLSDAEREQAA